jgi:hypothetical protein
MTGTYAVSISDVQVVMSYVSATALQLAAWDRLWGLLLSASAGAVASAPGA